MSIACATAFRSKGQAGVSQKPITRACTLLLLVAQGIVSGQGRSGEVFFLAASPYGRGGFAHFYESELYSASSTGIAMVRRIATSKEGVEFILADYAGGAIAIGKPGGRPTVLDVIFMRNPGQQVTRPLGLTSIPSSSWKPLPSSSGAAAASTAPPTVTGKGITTRTDGSTWIALDLIQDGHTAVAYPLTGTPNTQPEPVSLLNRGRPVVHGSFGFPHFGLGDSDTLRALFEGGRWTTRRAEEIATLDLPPIQEPAGNSTFWTILAHTEAATVVQLGSNTMNDKAARTPGFAQTRIHRARTGKWEPFDIAGQMPNVRIIGTWILAIAGEERGGRSSPGAGNRRTPALSRGAPSRPNNKYRFENDHAYYPGVLVLLETTGGTTVTIRTNEGDSEPLLVDGSTVYYRVNDQILKAEIRGNGVGAPVLLGRADEFRDIHWAFVSR